ncbi:MAG: hypothetical protein JW976_07995 [Syntrophaceae bacterium]|nr:hypothetical protein [Syntrophaceae bacterium]
MRETEQSESSCHIENYSTFFALPTDDTENEDSNTKKKIDERKGIPSKMHNPPPVDELIIGQNCILCLTKKSAGVQRAAG